MTNFIAGILTGFIIFGVIIIIVDQLRTRGFSTNPIDILGGVLLYIVEAMKRSAKRVAEWSVKRKYPYAKDEYIDEARIEAEDEVLDIYDEDAMYDEAEMEFIDNMVDFCEGKVI